MFQKNLLGMYCPPGIIPYENNYFVLIYFHSNGCDTGDMLQSMRQTAHELNVHVVLVEFPG